MGRRKSAAKALAGFSLAELQSIIAQRTAAEVNALGDRRTELLRELADVDAALAAAGSAPKRGPGRPRKIDSALVGAKSAAKSGAKKGRTGKRGPRGEGGLQSMVRAALDGAAEPMKLADVAAKVLELGYQTSSTRFAVIVGQRLSEMKDVKRVGRGLYQLRGK